MLPERALRRRHEGSGAGCAAAAGGRNKERLCTRSLEAEEPNVVPLIDVSLVILVMLLTIAAHAARTMPLAVPRAAKVRLMEAGESTALIVAKDGSFHLRMAAAAGQTGDEVAVADCQELSQLLKQLPQGAVLTITTEPGVSYKAFVKAMDCILAEPDLKVAFGGGTGHTAAVAGTAAPTTRPAT